MLNKLGILIVAVACNFFFVTHSSATPILQLDNNGLLLGAKNVAVNGATYDVQFMDGECGSIAHLCDFPSSFTFQSSLDARRASQALLDQVLLGVYDENYMLTNGCNELLVGRSGCAILTPYTNYLVDPYTVILAEAAFNSKNNNLESWLLLGTDSTRTIWDYATYAVWTPVPEPSNISLMVLAGITLIWSYRRQRKY